MKIAAPVVSMLLLLILVPLPASGVDISAVYPPVVTAGTPVTVIGGPFGPETRVDLGGRELPPRSIGSRQLVFITPQLPAGDYALFLRDGAGSSKQTLSLRIELPPPVIRSLTPDHLDECTASEERQVSLRGENIQPGAQLLLDGAVIPYQRKDDLSLSLFPQALRAGSHGLQLVNPDGKSSLPHTLWISSLPEIETVSEGENFVNSYQVVISGKNFFPNSVLLITEYPGGFGDLPPRQWFVSVQAGAPSGSGGSQQGLPENVSFQDCHTLIYNRHPPSGQAMRLVLRVGNPDGQLSQPYEVELP